MKKSAQPTDYYRAYQLARKLAAKRAKRIKELEKFLKDAYEGYAIQPTEPWFPEVLRLLGIKNRG